MYSSIGIVLAILVIALAPYAAAAQVRINEIAWMGTDEGGANCEWIELYNADGSVVDLSGWSISITNTGNTAPKVLSLGEAVSVKYSGIAGNGFYLVARNSGTCASLAPGKDADWLGSFGNGISNSGAKIVLLNAGTEVDSVNAEAGWTVSGGIGGKNPSGGTKETPQYSGGAWITSTPTPRSLNATAPVDTLPEPEETGTSTPVVTIGGTTPVTPVASPVIKLYLDPGSDRIVAAGAETPYDVVVYDATGKLRPNAEVTWNFGDGMSEKGRSVRHAYQEAGEYLAVVRAREKLQSSIATVSIVATPAAVRISETSPKGITLTNEGDRMTDLSLWEVKAGKKQFTLPEDTALLPGSSLFLAASVTGLSTTTEAVLRYPGGKVATAYTPDIPEVPVAEEESVIVPVAVQTIAAPVYMESTPAPAVHPGLAAVGAAVPHTNVVLKEKGWNSLLDALLDSFAPFIVR